MIAKKAHPLFRVPNYGAKNRKKVPLRWRRQRGIDNKQRVHVRCHGASPRIGYKNAQKARFARRHDGALEFLIYNERDIAAMPAGNYVAVLAHGLSMRKRVKIQELAEKKGIRVANKVKAQAEAKKQTAPVADARKAEAKKLPVVSSDSRKEEGVKG